MRDNTHLGEEKKSQLQPKILKTGFFVLEHENEDQCLYN